MAPPKDESVSTTTRKSAATIVLERRVDDIERGISDITRTISEHDGLLDEFSKWRTAMELNKVREEERSIALLKRLDSIDADLKSIKEAWKKVQWIVISVVAAAAVTFLLKGGLNIT